MNYIILRIPFATKKYIKNESIGLKITGNVFYVFDIKLNLYIDEYIEIKKGNYRLTDKNMLKTSYYNDSKIFKKFREDFLNKFSNVNPNEILELRHNDLNDKEIEIINKEFKTLNTTIRNMYACLSGSNPSGAETNNKATPILCNDWEYFKCNFASVLKKFQAPKKLRTKNYDKNNIKVYTLDDFLKQKKISRFKEIFYDYNQDLNYIGKMPTNINNNSDKSEYNEEFIEPKDKYKIKENQELFIISYINKTLDMQITKEKLKNKLRSYYISNVKECIQKKYIPTHSTIFKSHLSQIENAHIFSFSSLIKNENIESLKKAIDPYNCLRIDSNYHKLWDKQEIKFDLNGNVIFQDGKKEKYLDIKSLPKQTLEYLKKSLN